MKMKTRLFFILTLLIISSVYLPIGVAQDYTTWNLPEGAKARLGKGSIGKITYSPDGSLLAVGSSVGLWLYDTETLKELRLLAAYNVSFSPDGLTLASTGWDNTVHLWDVSTGVLTSEFIGHTSELIGHTYGVTSVSFSPDGATLASAGWDKTVRLWDVASATETATLRHPSGVLSVAFSPDGTTLASASVDKTVRLWDVASATETATLIGHTGNVSSVVFSPDGGTLASAGGYQDNTVRLWDVASATETATLTGHRGGISSVAFRSGRFNACQ